MPGSVFIRPLEAKLFRDVELFRKMDPYCVVTMGDRSIKGTICKKGGKHPLWNDIMVFRKVNEPVCVVELMDKDTLTSDDMIGVCEIDLEEAEEEGRLVKWYELHYKRKLAGEILIEIVISDEDSPKDPALYVNKKLTKRQDIRGHDGKKAARKHIIEYKERKPKMERPREASVQYAELDILDHYED